MYTPESQQYYIDLTKKFLHAPVGKEDLETLKECLIFHERKYYIEDNPLIADFEYDQLYHQLIHLEEQYPDLITPDSPTQRVSTDLSGEFPPVQHLVPMLSLDNSYNEDDLRNFDNAVKKLCGLTAHDEVDYCVEPKFDGGSIALVYEKDLLVRGATRGNGTMGEEMTKMQRLCPVFH